MREPLLEVCGLAKHFAVGGGWLTPGLVLRAVENVSFGISRGEVLGLVGESGSGKTTIARCALRLMEPTAGSIRFAGTDLRALSERALKPLRRRMQYVFQDPYSSLSARMTVEAILTEGMRIQRLGTARQRRDHAATALAAVELPASALERYPHEFSGGQRQRIGIARALALDPELLVADEPVSALDVSIQAQIVNLLRRLQSERALAMLFISHDLAVVEYLCDRVIVLYLGRVMEAAPTTRLFEAPQHPYTRALMAAVPVPDPKAPRRPPLLAGDIPSPLHPPSGCVLHGRCAHATEQCRAAAPSLREVAPGHLKACWRDDLPPFA